MPKKVRNSIIVLLYSVPLFPQVLIAQEINSVTLDPVYSQREIENLKTHFLHKGDDWSYKQYMYNNFDFKQFAYALLMANKYDNSRACYYVYWCLVQDLYERYDVEVDSATYNLVLPYLNKGANHGDANCAYVLSYLEKSKKQHEQDSLCKKMTKEQKKKYAFRFNEDYDLMFRIMHTGDTQAFNNYLSEVNDVTALPVAVLMANRYNNNHACYLIYDIIVTKLFVNNNIEIDSTNLGIAISFLKKGAMNGSCECLSELSSMYKNGAYFPDDLNKKAEEYERKSLECGQNLLKKEEE